MKRNNFRVLNRVKIVEMRSEVNRRELGIEHKRYMGVD